jgi:AcrR family transcriptional regulator
VFSELGYEAATFQAIAIRADLTRPAINHYFSNKRVLYREVVQLTNAAVMGAGVAKAREYTDVRGRISAFFSAVMDAESRDRSAAAFLVTSVLEAQRHADLVDDEYDPLQNSRDFVGWAVREAVESGELTTGTDVAAIVEMLVAVMWGMGFYAGYVGNRDELAGIVDTFELLMANRLWQLHERE